MLATLSLAPTNVKAKEMDDTVLEQGQGRSSTAPNSRTVSTSIVERLTEQSNNIPHEVRYPPPRPPPRGQSRFFTERNQ